MSQDFRQGVSPMWHWLSGGSQLSRPEGSRQLIHILGQISCRPIWVQGKGTWSPYFKQSNVKVFMAILNLPQALLCIALPGLWSLTVSIWISLPRYATSGKLLNLSVCFLQYEHNIYCLLHGIVVRIQWLVMTYNFAGPGVSAIYVSALYFIILLMLACSF